MLLNPSVKTLGSPQTCATGAAVGACLVDPVLKAKRERNRYHRRNCNSAKDTVLGVFRIAQFREQLFQSIHGSVGVNAVRLKHGRVPAIEICPQYLNQA